MKEIRLQFEAGEGTLFNAGVNYLLGENEEIRIYAEVAVEDGASEDYGYMNLKKAVLAAAKANNIDTSAMVFWYDGQEEKLESDADAGKMVYVCIETEDMTLETEVRA